MQKSGSYAARKTARFADGRMLQSRGNGMKRIVFAMIVALCGTLASFSDEQFPTIPVLEKPAGQMSKEELKEFYARRKAAIDALSPEQRKAYLEKQKANRIALAGGIIRKTDGKGRVVYANTQSTVKSDEIAKALDSLAKFIHVRIDTMDATAGDVEDIGAFLRNSRAEAAIVVVDNASDPTLLVAPEDRWAKVNVGKLKGKNVGNRTRIELLRAFCYLCGGIGSEYRNALTSFIGAPEQLDDPAVAELQLPIDVVNRFPPYLKQIGVLPYVETTYRRACREGWAPAPTNAVQKAIWEEINAGKERGPANALRIPPPRAKK